MSEIVKPRLTGKLKEIRDSGSTITSIVTVDVDSDRCIQTLKTLNYDTAKIGDLVTFELVLTKDQEYTLETMPDFITNKANWVIGRLSEKDCIKHCAGVLIEFFDNITSELVLHEISAEPISE